MTTIPFTGAPQGAARHPATRIGLPALAAGSALFMAACASTPPPTAQLALAEAAITHAASAGSAESAPVEMASARDKLHRANVALIAKNHDQARTLAEEVQVDAQLAEARARTAKARRSAGTLQEDTRVLREEIGRKVP